MEIIENADTEGILPESIAGFTVNDFSSNIESGLVVCTKCLLGVGAYGAVFEGVLREDRNSPPKVVAVKFQALPEEDMLLNNLVAELSLLQGLSHENLLKYHGAALLPPPLPPPGVFLPFDLTSSCVAMVTEVARNGDLETSIAKAARARQQDLKLVEDGLPWALRVRCCAEVASALDFIHCQDVIHRDIKTANILLDANFHAKVCDFGLAIGADAPMKLLFVGGTDTYMAPEVLLAEPYGTSADVFSLGLVMVSLLSLRPIGEPYNADIPLPEFGEIREEEEDEEDDDDNHDHEEVVAFEDHHEVLEPHLLPIPPVLERHPRYFFEASGEEIRSSALPEAPPGFIDIAIQCCASDPDNRPEVGDVAMVLNEIYNSLVNEESGGQPLRLPQARPTSLLEFAVPKVQKELTRWNAFMKSGEYANSKDQTVRLLKRPNRPPPSLPNKPSRPVPLAPGSDSNEDSFSKPTATSNSFNLPPRPKTPPPKASASFSHPPPMLRQAEQTSLLPPRPKTPPPSVGPRLSTRMPLPQLSPLVDAASSNSSNGLGPMPERPPQLVDELTVLLSSLSIKVKEKSDQDRASKVKPHLLVGRWVFIQGLGLGQVAEFHRVKSITKRRTHDSYHTVELTAMTQASNTSADVVTRSGSVLIPNVFGSRDSRFMGSTQDVLSHDVVSFDASRASTANLCPTSPTKRVPSTKRVRCLLRRRKMGAINAGLKFVLVESALLPDVSPSNFNNSGGNGAGGGGDNLQGAGSDDEMSDDGADTSGRDESEVSRRGWLSLERVGGGFLPRYFTLTELGLGYSKGPEKPPKNDATHCVLLPHLHVATDPSNPRRFRVGKWYLECVSAEETKEWVTAIEVAVRKASNHHM